MPTPEPDLKIFCMKARNLSKNLTLCENWTFGKVVSYKKNLSDVFNLDSK